MRVYVGNPSQGDSFIAEAVPSRDLILPYTIIDDGRKDKVMVDFSKITPDMITDI